MKQEPKVMSVLRTSAFELDPTLTGEEGIVLRALAAGQTDRHVCHQLRMDPATFLRLMRDMREKIGTADNLSLIAWAKRQMKGIDQRIDRPERYARLA
jgi:DNA-binding CsgD family transcriptional regulator